MRHWNELPDLASEHLGGRVLWANDDFFAEKENLLKRAPAVWIAGKYTDRGKWMDGWESRRRREPGHDVCVLKLGLPGIVRGVDVDTSHFTGNFPEGCSIDACDAPADATAEDLERAAWREILPASPLHGDTHNLFPIHHAARVTHLRLHILPDGGVARLRVHGEVEPELAQLRGLPEVDLAALEHGGRVLVSSDAYFGSHHNLLQPGRSGGMHDGWETRRKRRGFDWCLVRLFARGTIRKVHVDTNHFKGNYPDRFALDVIDAVDAPLDVLVAEHAPWRPLLGEHKLEPHAQHAYAAELEDAGPVTHAKLKIYPDGGVSRLRLWGTVA